MSESTGVRVVDGSEPDAVAYRINPSLHLRKTMRYRMELQLKIQHCLSTLTIFNVVFNLIWLGMKANKCRSYLYGLIWDQSVSYIMNSSGQCQAN